MSVKSKQTVFNSNNPLDMELLSSIEILGLNFSEETKVLWASKISGIDADKTRKMRRISILKIRLNDKTIHRSYRHRIEKEIQQIEGALNENS